MDVRSLNTNILNREGNETVREVLNKKTKT